MGEVVDTLALLSDGEEAFQHKAPAVGGYIRLMLDEVRLAHAEKRGNAGNLGV